MAALGEPRVRPLGADRAERLAQQDREVLGRCARGWCGEAVDMDRSPVYLTVRQHDRIDGRYLSRRRRPRRRATRSRCRVTATRSGGALVAAEVRMPRRRRPARAAPPRVGRALPRRSGRARPLPRGRGRRGRAHRRRPGRRRPHPRAAASTRSATSPTRRRGRSSCSSPGDGDGALRPRGGGARRGRAAARGTSSPSRASTASR